MQIHDWNIKTNLACKHIIDWGILQKLVPMTGDLLCKRILKHPSQKCLGNKRYMYMPLVNKWLRNCSPKKYLSSKYGLWDLWTTYVEWLFHWLVLSYKKKFYTDARYIAQNSHICRRNLWQSGYIWQF